MRTIAFMLVIALSVGLTTPFAVVADSEDEATLRHLKTVLWPQAYREQDTALLDEILADEFQMVRADGNWSTKAQELEYIRHNAPSHDSFVFTIKRLEIFENGTAVVAGSGLVKGHDEAGPYAFEYQSSNILIKRDGKWKAIASHVSGVKDL